MREPELDRIANWLPEEDAAPLASVGAGGRTAAGFRFGVGHCRELAGLTQAPLFDLASVTKPFVAVTAARLAARGVVGLETPLGELLPEVARTPSASLPLVLFLAHRAGLEAHRPLYAPLLRGAPFRRPEAVREAAEARRADATGPAPPEGFAPLYSDLGYVLVGAALESATGLPLDVLVEREVSAPLALDVRSARGWLERDAHFLERVAPTETVPFRGGPIHGVVHDENAWALAGHGLAGQAGLFGSAESVVRFGAALLDAAAGRALGWLEPSAVHPLLVERPGGSLRAGFDGKSGPTPSAGSLASAATYGHLGFTGTSLWCDPLRGSVTVLLSNRVCPSRDNLKIRALRPRVHDALFGWVEGLVSRDQA